MPKEEVLEWVNALVLVSAGSVRHLRHLIDREKVLKG